MMPSTEARQLRHLWTCVLAQALRDIFRTASSKYGCDDLEHAAVMAWIGTRDFHQVCALAGLDGRAVHDRLKRRMAEHRAGTFNPTLIFARRGGEPDNRQSGAYRRRMARERIAA